jgi:hypothetical protein
MKTLRLAAAVGLLATPFLPLAGQLSLVTSRAAFPTTDTVNWATLGTTFTTVMSPFTVATTGGSSVTVAHDVGVVFERRDQGLGWLGNFPAGDALLWNRGNNGFVTFDPAELISGAGFNVQANSPNEFTFTLEAYGVGGTLLGSVTEAGFSGSRGTAIFIGFTSPLANVDKFVASVQSGGGSSDFAVNTLVLSAGPQGDAGPGVVPVPEPSVYGVMGALVVFGLVGRERLRRHSEA